MPGCMSQDSLSLWIADMLNSLQRSDCCLLGRVVRETNVFRGLDHDPPSDEPWIVAGVDQFCQPVERCVRIRASHRFDEGADRVVVLDGGAAGGPAAEPADFTLPGDRAQLRLPAELCAGLGQPVTTSNRHTICQGALKKPLGRGRES